MMMMMKNTELIARLKNCGMPGSLEMQAADALEAAQAEIDQLKPLADVGSAMVGIITTVWYQNEWGAIPEIWLMCMRERDTALARLAEIESHHKEVLADLDIRINYAEERLATFGKQEPALWQYRWTNPGGGDQPESALEWKPVAASWNQSVQEKCKELEGYRYNGKPTYEVRGLYAAAGASPEPSQAVKLSDEQLRCIEEAHNIANEESYFLARPNLEVTPVLLSAFTAAHRMGWYAAINAKGSL